MNIVNPLSGRAADALIEARAYAPSDAGRAFVALLEAMEAQYKACFEFVTVDGLVPLQTALKQTAAIRVALTAEHPLDPKIL